MLRKGFTKFVTFVLAVAFVLSSVAAIPAAAGETEESEIDSQVQTNNEIAVEDSETSNADSEEITIDNADSNEANNPEESVESSADPTEEETAGGESSESNESDDAAVEESEAVESESSQIESSVMEEGFYMLCLLSSSFSFFHL